MKVIFNTNVYNNQYSPNEYTVFPAKYEVDWFRYYKRFEPGNIIISQPIDLPTEEYNVLVGEDFIFNCEQIIHDGENLKIIASNSVTLLGGFQVVSGGQLEISIDNSIND